MEVARTMALLYEATEGTRSQDHPLVLMIGDTAGEEGPRALYLMQRWLHLVWNIQEVAPQLFRLHLLPSSPDRSALPPALVNAQFSYRITQTSVALEMVEENPQPGGVAGQSEDPQPDGAV